MSKRTQNTVVMVDDDHEDVFAVRKALKNSRFQIDFNAIDSGDKFLEIMADTNAAKPDLILLDINMPRMNGYDVLGALKGDERWQNLPVVMLTTSDSDADEKKSLELGATAFVTKPHSAAEMASLIMRLEQCIVASHP